jgi:hypothetical protein
MHLKSVTVYKEKKMIKMKYLKYLKYYITSNNIIKIYNEQKI